MNKNEYNLYKNQILMKATGANIHMINNQLGIILCAINMQELCECEHEDISYDDMITMAKETINRLLK